MARIPDQELERIKRETSLVQLAEQKGVKLQSHGANLIGLCPFHDDKNPSLVIDPEKNLWNCLGACQQGGSVIDWVMKTEGLSFRHAVEVLNKQATLSSAGAVKRSSTPKLPCPISSDAEDKKLLLQVIEYYHRTLKESPEALQYLDSRGLASPDLIDRFKLGYANRTLGLRLPQKNRKAGSDIRARLQKLGILRESGHEHFNGSIIIPVFNLEGEITEVYSRKINDNLREGTAYHLYLPGPHKGVWNEQGLQNQNEVVLCESLIDALTVHAAGFHNVTTSYGVAGFTDDHLAAFKRHGIEHVLIAYDRDDAGDK